jgi:hypothetical protein
MASAIFKWLRDAPLVEDEGVVFGYNLGDKEYVAIQISNDHFGVSFEKAQTSLMFSATQQDYDYNIEFLDKFVMMGTNDSAKIILELLGKYFRKVEMRHGPRDWNSNQQSVEIMTVLNKIKINTPLFVEYLSRGESQTFNYGSPDSCIYSSYEPNEEVAISIKDLNEQLQNKREELLVEYANKIKAHYIGWKTRMQYAFNPTTTLGKYYVLKAFDELMFESDD